MKELVLSVDMQGQKQKQKKEAAIVSKSINAKK